MNNIWVFGDSFSTNYAADAEIKVEQSWPEIVGQKLNKQVRNFAHPAVDNFFIYSNYVNQKPLIKSTDIVLLQWTMPTRKMFILDKNNTTHQQVIDDTDIVVTRNNVTYFRSGTRLGNWVPNLTTKDSGVKFFDEWYRNYFDITESETNLQAYQQASKQPNTVHLHFSEMLDFIKQHKLYVSKDDHHPNVQGHQQLANTIMEKINEQIL